MRWIKDILGLAKKALNTTWTEVLDWITDQVKAKVKNEVLKQTGESPDDMSVSDVIDLVFEKLEAELARRIATAKKGK
ncbi:MAG TPA: hypothetical protein PLF11_00065 [Bacillota bacterium]|nr:hypothetical protein [Dermatophilaceae bacterium]HOI35753.1 hypothetical protein [Bacillota bacterium]